MIHNADNIVISFPVMIIGYKRTMAVLEEHRHYTRGGITMADRRIDYEAGKRRARKYVRYREGAAIYNMGLTKFSQLAREAKAVYKVMVLSLLTRRFSINFWRDSDYIEEKRDFLTRSIVVLTCTD